MVTVGLASACGLSSAQEGGNELTSAANVPEMDTLSQQQLLTLALERTDRVHDDAIAELRARGPESLDFAIEAFEADKDWLSAHAPRWRHVIGEIAAQRDADISHLFWLTDLEEAKRLAAREGKPILSLRMLGDLRDEFSCANSRLFRAVLYADPGVSQLMRERFVLHWSSERDVPRVTIEFGDGRRLERTITGNSVHYVLNAEGEVLDVLPGMWEPMSFAENLVTATALFNATQAEPTRLGELRREHHKRELERAQSELYWRLRQTRGNTELPSAEEMHAWLVSTPAQRAERDQQATRDLLAPAEDAMVLTVSKAMIERPILNAVGMERRESARRYKLAPRDEEIRLMASRGKKAAAYLSAGSKTLIEREQPFAHIADAATRAAKLEALYLALAQSTAEDSMLNEYGMRPVVHAWLAEDPSPSFETLNRRIYDELFMTPAADPWLGLLDDQTYSGLVRGGVTLSAGAPQPAAPEPAPAAAVAVRADQAQ